MVRGDGLGRGFRFYLSIIFAVSLLSAMIIRVIDAYVQGDVWLAFSRRSDVGWPAAHILALIALASWLYLTILKFREKKETKGLCKTPNLRTHKIHVSISYD